MLTIKNKEYAIFIFFFTFYFERLLKFLDSKKRLLKKTTTQKNDDSKNSYSVLFENCFGKIGFGEKISFLYNFSLILKNKNIFLKYNIVKAQLKFRLMQLIKFRIKFYSLI